MRFATLFFLILFNLPAALPQQSSYQLNLENGRFPKENQNRYFQDAMECPGSIKGLIHVQNEKSFTFFPHQALQAGESYDCVFLPPFLNLKIQKAYQYSLLSGNNSCKNKKIFLIMIYKSKTK